MELSIFTWLVIFVLVVFIALFGRMNGVFSYRKYIINRIYDVSMEELERGNYDINSSSKRYARLNEPPINKSTLQIWKPIKSFYDMDYIIYGRKKDVR